MDPEELRKAIVEENATESDPDPVTDPLAGLEQAGDVVHLIRNEAHKINALFNDTADSGERRRLRERYDKLDGWLGDLKAADSIEDAGEAEEARRTTRAAALEEMRKWRGPGDAHRKRLHDIEAGRKELAEKAKAGAGKATQKRIKDEIEYLIKNYTASNEAKIETLIDKWRRSGDPGYDPSIKLKLRSARKKKDTDNYAL